ncbi:MAG TPA: hypothetical protein PLL69_00125 [Gemmatimonadales bacterium]|nr:hypothetical protein [Gemmatimonadales bacterium]
MHLRGALAVIFLCAPVAAQERLAERDPLAAELHAFGERLLAACPEPATDNLDRLVAEERTVSYRLQGRSAGGDEWLRLACLRSRLYALGAVAREGLVMPPGYSWAGGAAEAVLSGLDKNPTDVAKALELLGILAFEEYPDRLRTRISQALVGAAENGARSRYALRACSEYLLRERLRDEAMACSTRALAAGFDSTWQLLNLARHRFAAGDTTGGEALFLQSIDAIRDSSDLSAMDWHLQWFLEPEEQAEWDLLPPSARGAWVRDLLIERDFRDGRPAGARLAAHFERLEAVDTLFRLQRSLKDTRRFALTATPENEIGTDWVAKWTRNDPAQIPAKPFRFFLRSHLWYDDRAAVWMRWGPPDERHLARPQIHFGSRGNGGRCASEIEAPEGMEHYIDLCTPPGSHFNSREGWLYRMGGRSLLLSFEGENFDRSGEATRLVAGVLGFYLCGLETSRCNLTNRSNTAGLPVLPPETISNLRSADQKLIDRATTEDDNTVHQAASIVLSASASRLWNPVGDGVIVLVPYSIRAESLEEIADGEVVELSFRQWDPGETIIRDTVAGLRVSHEQLGRSRAHLTGVIVVSSAAAVSAWSLVAVTPEGQQGHSWGRGLPDLAGGSLELSDLAVGAASQGRGWRSPTGLTVPLGPLDAFDHGLPISLYWQSRARNAMEARIAIVVQPVDARGEGLQVEFLAGTEAGLTEFQRDLDLSRLEPGRYRLELTLTSADGSAQVTRRREVVLW